MTDFYRRAYEKASPERPQPTIRIHPRRTMTDYNHLVPLIDETIRNWTPEDEQKADLVGVTLGQVIADRIAAHEASPTSTPAKRQTMALDREDRTSGTTWGQSWKGEVTTFARSTRTQELMAIIRLDQPIKHPDGRSVDHLAIPSDYLKS